MATSETAFDGLMPLGAEELTPLGPSELTPLVPLGPADLTPLTPLGSSQPNGLTPLVPLVPLMPLDGLTPLTPLASNPFAGAGGSGPINPYASPAAAPQAFHRPGEVAPLVTMLPAIFLMVSTVPTFIYLFIQGIGSLLMLVQVLSRSSNGPAAPTELLVGAAIARLLFCLAWFCVVLLIVKGSFDLLNRQSYGWALTAAILSMLCCTLGIGFPFGLWALVVLCLPDVRRAFRT